MINTQQCIGDAVPHYIIAIHQKIEQEGYDCFIVGGAVRDLLMGVTPIEYDLASNAPPDEIIRLFNAKTRSQFGMVRVFFEGQVVEITCFRKEGGYDDFRHPSQLEFVSDIESDLHRRDFTINAMAYHPIKRQLIDLFQGQLHLKNRQLVCVGNPYDRFSEDTLRPYRCFRFMAQLGFGLDASIPLALCQSASLPLPAIERIKSEITRLLKSPDWVLGIQAMIRYGWWPFSSEFLYPPASCELDVDYRWAWLVSLGDVSDGMSFLGFSKSFKQRLLHIIAWDFDPFCIELSVADLQISSKELQAFGFFNQTLGQVQKELLNQIRLYQIENNAGAIRSYLKEQYPEPFKGLEL